MANKPIHQLGLPKRISHIFTVRNIITAKDALSLTEFDLMELLDVALEEVTSAIAQISEVVCPPCQTALSLMEQRVQNEKFAGHLPTHLLGLDEVLCGGIPFGVLTELVGPAGVGKTQFCLKLSLLACLPATHGGLDGHVIYIDVESKFSSRRLIEIGANSFPEIFHTKGMAKEMAGRILILRPASVSEFTERMDMQAVNSLNVTEKGSSDKLLVQMYGRIIQIEKVHEDICFLLQVCFTFECLLGLLKLIGLIISPANASSLHQIKLLLLNRQVKLLIVDSMAALVLGECDNGHPRQHVLGWHVSYLKSLAELSRIPVIVTNQVRSKFHAEASQYPFQAQSCVGKIDNPDTGAHESNLVAALGINWAHAVTIRLVLETRSGQRFIKVAKSPVSPPLAFPFCINSSGISLLNDDGMDITGPTINSIHFQGYYPSTGYNVERLQ